jgi:hypothetical protein
MNIEAELDKLIREQKALKQQNNELNEKVTRLEKENEEAKERIKKNFNSETLSPAPPSPPSSPPPLIDRTDEFFAEIEVFLQAHRNYNYRTEDIMEQAVPHWEKDKDLLLSLRLDGKKNPRNFRDITEAGCDRLWKQYRIQKGQYAHPVAGTKRQPRVNDFRWFCALDNPVWCVPQEQKVKAKNMKNAKNDPKNGK